MSELNELSGRMEKLQDKIDLMIVAAEERVKSKPTMPQLATLIADGYEPNAAVEALQLLCSAILCEEISEQNLRLALQEVATRFESLDDWMTAGGTMPAEWTRNR